MEPFVSPVVNPTETTIPIFSQMLDHLVCSCHRSKHPSNLCCFVCDACLLSFKLNASHALENVLFAVSAFIVIDIVMLFGKQAENTACKWTKR